MFGVSNAEETWEEGVLVLTDSNFDEAIAKYDYLLVEFYAPWCGHCKKLAPEYAQAAAKLGAQDPPRYIAKVDATENKEVAERHGIKGFPTLVFYANGNKSDYTGGRTEDTIVQWINKKTGPPSEEVDCAGMETKTAEGKLNLSYFGDVTGDLWDAFFGAARDPAIGEKYQFFHTTDAACGEKFGLSGAGVALSRRFDDSPLQYSGDKTTDAIVSWAKASSVPILISFSEDYIEPIFSDHNPALILFTEETGNAWQDAYAGAAKDLAGEILFVTSGVTDGIQARLGDFLGVTKDDMPTLRLIDPSENMTKYVWDGDITTINTDILRTYVSDFKAKKLTPHLKSEEIPEDMSTPVTTLVGKNWEQIVKDETKDVLVKYYAPWCGHCKALAPTWDQLGEDVKDIEDLVIAKFDATANEVAGLEIRGYPTLKFYPKDNKAGVDYSGDRELDDFKKWFAENSAAYKAARPAAIEGGEASGEHSEL
jgi:protein disulfide-isomerase A1